MQKITMNNLTNLIRHLNRVTKNPEEPYTKGHDGKFTANIGSYHLDAAYGGYKLVQMHSAGGGITDTLNTGFVPKRTLFNAIHLFLRGIEARSNQ